MNAFPAPVDVRIRPAIPADVSGVHALLMELAQYERLAHEVQATPDLLREALFGEHPAAEAVVADSAGRLVGYALYFTTYSTFVGRPGVYLEDLFVQPAARGCGVGKRLLNHIAQIAADRNCGRLEWAVLDWNQPAITFYERMGARALSDWTLYRMTGDRLAALASNQTPAQ